MDSNWFKDAVTNIADTVETMARGITRDGKLPSPVDEVYGNGSEEIINIYWVNNPDAVQVPLPTCITSLICEAVNRNADVTDALSLFIRIQSHSDEWGDFMLLNTHIPVSRGHEFIVEYASQGSEETGWHTRTEEYVFTDPGIHKLTRLGG